MGELTAADRLSLGEPLAEPEPSRKCSNEWQQAVDRDVLR
jgi:hypothetical protein